MFYYKVDGNKIFKYEVSYDLEIVKKLQNELANDCSIEKEYTYSSVGVPRRDKNVKYKKFEYKFVDTRYDFYGDLDIYEVNTIELINPYLYEVIEKIIGGNTNSLEELFSYKVECVNEKEKNIAYYVDLFQREFSFELIDTLDLDIYNKVSEFLGLNKLKNKEINLVCNLVKS